MSNMTLSKLPIAIRSVVIPDSGDKGKVVSAQVPKSEAPLSLATTPDATTGREISQHANSPSSMCLPCTGKRQEGNDLPSQLANPPIPMDVGSVDRKLMAGEKRPESSI